MKSSFNTYDQLNAQLKAKNYKAEAGKDQHVSNGEKVIVMSGFTLSEDSEAQAILKEPSTKPWGQEVAYLRDINGIIVELCSPMG